MNKTKIEWCDYTVNPIRGLCRHDCWYCYAKRMYKHYGWNEHIRQDNLAWTKGINVHKLETPSKIFVGSTHDIFGDWIPYHWITEIIEVCKKYPQHTFIFLTKNPKRYAEFLFPDNCWLGVSVSGEETIQEQAHRLTTISNISNIKFISYEPLLQSPMPEFGFVDWVIIGGLTPRPVHEKEWVSELIERYRYHKIPIFLKDNLNWHEKRQEFPNFNLSRI